MATTADLSPTIIESLYCEALELADEARSIFDLSGRLDLVGEDEDLARVALSCEALRTTTRLMHARCMWPRRRNARAASAVRCTPPRA